MIDKSNSNTKPSSKSYQENELCWYYHLEMDPLSRRVDCLYRDKLTIANTSLLKKHVIAQSNIEMKPIHGSNLFYFETLIVEEGKHG